METLFLYFAKVILCSGVMFLYYRIFLKDKTFHHYNRFYLLGTLGVSLLLPLLKVDYFTINVNQNIYELLLLLQNNSTSNISANDFSIYPIIFAIVALVAVFFVAKFGFALWKINQFKKEYPQEKLEGISFYMTNLENAPFSFFRNLFWKKSILLQSDLGKQILKHEMVHIEQKHSYDKMLIEILTAVFWFNPIFYFIKKEINLIHEYLADKKALKNSDTKAFAQMLLETHFSGQVLPGTSPFLNSNLKKRIIMLKKSNTKFSYFRKVFALPLLFCLFFAYMVKAENREIETINNSLQENLISIKNDTIRSQNLYAVVLDSTDSKTNDSFDSNVNQPLRNFNDVYNEIKEVVAEAKKINGPIIYSTKTKDNLRNEIIKIDTLKPKNKSHKVDGKKKSVLKTDKTVTYFIDGKEINYDQLNKVNPKDVASFEVKKNGEMYFTTRKVGEPNIDNPWIISVGAHETGDKINSGTSYFIPLDKSTDEGKAIANKENQYIIGNSIIAPPQSKYKVSQTGKAVSYTSAMSYTTDEDSPENLTITGTTDYSNAKVYINGKISDEKTAKNLDPKKIKTVNVKRHNNNGVEKNEVRITTKR